MSVANESEYAPTFELRRDRMHLVPVDFVLTKKGSHWKLISLAIGVSAIPILAFSISGPERLDLDGIQV